MKQIHLPGFIQSLQDKDLGHLRIIAEGWGLEFPAANVKEGLLTLAQALDEAAFVERLMDDLPLDAREALRAVLGSEGIMPWTLFIRRFGEIREMGPGRRDRERPDKKPISAAEILWYRGLIARAFFDWKKKPEEFAYVPLEIYQRLPEPKHEQFSVLGRLALSEECDHPFLANDLILDHACTYLAALRAEVEDLELIQRWVSFGFPLPISILFLNQLLSAVGLIGENGMPKGEAVRSFLGQTRKEAFKTLVDTWVLSASVNEMGMLPGLRLEGAWKNDPLSTRKTLIELIGRTPGKIPDLTDQNQDLQKTSQHQSNRPLVNLSSFIASVKESNPDIQRSAGDYEASFIQDVASGEFLRGFQNWDLVEGKLIRYMICGPMHWLGLLDLASGSTHPGDIKAFRVSRIGEYLFQGRELAYSFPDEDEQWSVEMSGLIHVPRFSPRSGRYLISRFCTWETCDEGEFRYMITPASLQKARRQGLQISQFIHLLRKYAKNIPPNVIKALERWDIKGSEVQVDQLVVLRVKNPEILDALRSSRVARYLGEPLGKNAVVIPKGVIHLIREVINEMGYLSEINIKD